MTESEVVPLRPNNGPLVFKSIEASYPATVFNVSGAAKVRIRISKLVGSFTIFNVYIIDLDNKEHRIDDKTVRMFIMSYVKETHPELWKSLE